MAKKKVDKKSKILKYTAWVLAIIALMLLSVVLGFYFGYGSANSEVAQKEKTATTKRLKALEKIEKSLQKETRKPIKARLQEVLKNETKISDKIKYLSAVHELDSSATSFPIVSKREIKLTTLKPRLAIIIDDVSTKRQVQRINSLHITLTKSFLPPSHDRPNTPRLAKLEKFYMVHLPMEAQSFTAEEPYTLRVSDSKTNIFKRVQEIKKLFPKVHYINNHTGSKFTADETAMNKLIYALNKNKIHFIDSRTTAQTKAPKVMKSYGFKYVARDVFLDHEMQKDYVISQIKKAIQVAKKHGTAIAIGHPHPNTLQALLESKKLFDEVELVQIDQIY